VSDMHTMMIDPMVESMSATIASIVTTTDALTMVINVMVIGGITIINSVLIRNTSIAIHNIAAIQTTTTIGTDY